MREFFLRRLGPLPMWAWFLILVFGGAVLIVWLKHRNSKDATGTLNSDASLAPNLTNQAAQIYPYTSDVFVNIQRPEGGSGGGGGTRTTTPPTGGGSTPDRSHDDTTTPIPGGNIVQPPQRTTSVTYEVKAGDTLYAIAQKFGVPWQAIYEANKSTIEQWANWHGMNSSDNGHWIWRTEPLVIPVPA